MNQLNYISKCIRDARVFEPSLNVFKNGLLFNYKKVGSRFVQMISSGDIEHVNIDNRQVDFIFYSQPMPDIYDSSINVLEYEFSTKHIIAPWHTGHFNDSYPTWKEDVAFLSTFNKKSYTELFFENDKDVIFLIRDPLERFMSGLSQIILSFLDSFENNNLELEFFKKHSNIDEIDINSLLYKFKHRDSSPDNYLSSLSDEVLENIFKYLLIYKWELIFQDIHTEHYISHFTELIYNVKDKSKLKIIDLSHLRSTKAMEFFCYLRGDNLPKIIYENLDANIETNAKFYNIIKNKILNIEFNSFGHVYSPISFYLSDEIRKYESLINSQYFIDLQD